MRYARGRVGRVDDVFCGVGRNISSMQIFELTAHAQVSYAKSESGYESNKEYTDK